MTMWQNSSTHLFVTLIGTALAITYDTARCDESSANEIKEDPITDFDRDYWSFRPLLRPAVPITTSKTSSSRPLDHFISRQLKLSSTYPLDQATKTTLVRRLTFDLTGLPPTPEQVASFKSDCSPDAYDRLAERLLSSPRHGERWAQHWLDLARFAETDGFEHDKVRPDAWRYRDWVINALDEDIPYNRFVQLQLASDEIAPDDENAKFATSFCLSGPDMPDINSMDERKHNLLNELTATIGSSLLALQIRCAQCHDHKFDPISQADFYRLRAIFEPAIQLRKNKSVSVLKEINEKPGPSYLMVRGNWQRTGPEVSPAYPRIANPRSDELHTVEFDGKTSGRRTSLAHWITRDDHPLTSRVIVNRIWQHHFGRGLSNSPSDFGLMGDSPTHPELLDWLATEFIRREWSIKQLHRQIVTSATYMRAGVSDTSEQKSDQQIEAKHILYVRFPRRRLEGEEIRDAMLSSANVLNTQRGGLGVRPPLPEELKKTLLGGQWNETRDESQHDRRSIYVFARRNLRYPIFEAFDRPGANASCPQRNHSTTAPQSLLLLNSEFSRRSARRLAGYIVMEVGDAVDDQISLAFQQTLSRRPLTIELQQSRTFLAEQVKLLSNVNDSAEALADLCLALFNSNEFLYVD